MNMNQLMARIGGACLIGLALVSSAEAQTCIGDVVDFGLQCTAEDVRVASINILDEVDGCSFPGDTAQLLMQAELVAGASERYDIGFFIATDGGDAESGTCFRDYLRPPLADIDNYVPGTGGAGNGGGPFYDAEGDGDICGDLEQGVSTFFDLPQLVTVVCNDDDGDGLLEVGTCTSWDNNEQGLCENIDDTAPGTPSKCRCESVTIEVHVPGKIEVTKDAGSSTVVAPGDDVVYTVTVENISNNGVSLTIDTLDDDIFGDLNGQGNCTVPQVLADGASYQCSFTGAVAGAANTTHTNVVTASGVDENDNEVTDDDDADVVLIECETADHCDDGNACTLDVCNQAPMCGDANNSGGISATDALQILRAATGLSSNCTGMVCDVDASGSVTATDALRVLRSAVGLGNVMVCAPACENTDTSADCDDGDVCDGDETCDPAGGCQEGTPLVCDDGSDCTDDSCDPTDGCINETLECDDQNDCTVDRCAPDGGCMYEDVVCDDGDVCDGIETCNPDGGCQEGTPLVCDDGDVCDGDETCDPIGGCLEGDPLDCNDDSDCTEDTCDEIDGCMNESVECDDQDECTTDSCADDGGCMYEAVVCDDEDFCNGAETCDPTVGCVPGQAPDCDDGQYCNGEETCDPTQGCVDGDDPACADENVCTFDTCDEDLDECVFLGGPAAGIECYDGFLCTENDVCDGNGLCVGVGAPEGQDVITFTGFPAGTILTEVFGDGGVGPIAVNSENPKLPGMNAALVYDTSCPGGVCSGKGSDLGTPNETFGGFGVGVGGELGSPYENDTPMGNMLVVAKDLIDVAPADGLVDTPKDQANESVSTRFDFSAIAPVMVHEISIMDVELGIEAPAMVELYDMNNQLIVAYDMPETGDNGIAHHELCPAEGVWSMIVRLHGSGAIDNILFSADTCVEPTTTTTTTSTSTTTTTTTSTTSMFLDE